MNPFRLFPFLAVVALSPLAAAEKQYVVYEGKDGPGKGKTIVFLSGDEEYRSEEGLPQLARILSDRHGFRSVVCFAVDPKTGEIDPKVTNNIPGIEALDTAAGCVMALRFRELPDEQMKHFADYLQAGKPVIGLRTSTHAFNYRKDSKSPYAKYAWTSKEWPGGFGKQVLGETWISHWGAHKKEATRGVIELTARNHPVLRGVDDVFGTTDVYEAHPPKDAQILMSGEVLSGMNPTDPPVEGPKNDPMQPIAWTREWTAESGRKVSVLTTTMGAATDLLNEGLRRMIVNGVYWGQKLEVPQKADVTLVGEYQPSMYGFNGAKKGVKPADLQ
jgi:hypothetical protein